MFENTIIICSQDHSASLEWANVVVSYANRFNTWYSVKKLLFNCDWFPTAEECLSRHSQRKTVIGWCGCVVTPLDRCAADDKVAQGVLASAGAERLIQDPMEPIRDLIASHLSIRYRFF
jgi:hypothetical protein